MTPPNLSLLMIMICFWLTLWLVNRFLIVPIQGVIDERASKIDGAERKWLDGQEELRQATERLEAELSEAAKKAAALKARRRQEAVAAHEARMAEAREKAEAGLQTAVRKLADEAGKAREELRVSAEKLAVELAGRLLGREIGR